MSIRPEAEAKKSMPKACFGCSHVHLDGGPGRCWEAECDPRCPEGHNDFSLGVFPYTPDPL